MKEIRYFSATDFKCFMKSLGFTSYKWNRMMAYSAIPNSDFAVISIGNPEYLKDVDNDKDLWANGINNHWLPNCFENVLNIDFSDNGEEDFESLNEEGAQEIIDFIIKNENKSKFYIHCSAGISRSGAVSSVIYDFFKRCGEDVKIYPNYPKTPNYHVRNLLNNKLYKEKKFGE